MDEVEGIRHCMVDRKGRGEHSIHHNELLLRHHRIHSLALHLLNGRDLLLATHSAHTVPYMQRSSSRESEGSVIAGSSHQKMLRRQLEVHAIRELKVKEGGGKIVSSVRNRDDGGEGSLAKSIATEDAVSHLHLRHGKSSARLKSQKLCARKASFGVAAYRAEAFPSLRAVSIWRAGRSLERGYLRVSATSLTGAGTTISVGVVRISGGTAVKLGVVSPDGDLVANSRNVAIQLVWLRAGTVEVVRVQEAGGRERRGRGGTASSERNTVSNRDICRRRAVHLLYAGSIPGVHDPRNAEVQRVDVSTIASARVKDETGGTSYNKQDM